MCQRIVVLLLYFQLGRCCSCGWLHSFSALVSQPPSNIVKSTTIRQRTFGGLLLLVSTAMSSSSSSSSSSDNASTSKSGSDSMYSSAIRDHMGKRTEGPWIAVLTEPDACDSDERADETLKALQSALSSGCIDLVSIRVSFTNNNDVDDDSVFQQRLISLVQRVKILKQDIGAEFLLVVNDNIKAAIEGGADGVHVKEKDVATIPAVKQSLRLQSEKGKCIVGTSCHSIESALLSNSCEPDYLFVGTCYMTQSHTEKTAIDMLEGPELPGKVKEAILAYNGEEHLPIVFAIGGIDEKNAKEPVTLGADGVAAIRSILCASDPTHVALAIKKQ